jgi:hypothetical protein
MNRKKFSESLQEGIKKLVLKDDIKMTKEYFREKKQEKIIEILENAKRLNENDEEFGKKYDLVINGMS